MSDDDRSANLQQVLVDTHIHTRFSDGTASIDQIVRHCHDRSIGACVTDHNEIRGAVALCERGAVATLPGIEVGSEEGFDLLVYFPTPTLLEEFYVDIVEPKLRSRFMVRSWVQAVDCVQVAREMGGYVSLAHPFAFGRKSLDYQMRERGSRFVQRILDEVDALEVYNGGIQRQANLRAKDFSATSSKRWTVGSDSHRLRTIGSCGVYLDVAANAAPKAVFESLARSDDLEFRVSDMTVTLRTLGIIALKHTRHFVAKSRNRNKR
jgi:predicted metal-dependent phosphoesterase TrpH